MPRVPQKPPKWMDLLFEYLNKKERSDETSHATDHIGGLIETYWQSFHEKMAKLTKPRPKKEKDPRAALDGALSKYQQCIQESTEEKSDELLDHFRETLQDFSSKIQVPVLMNDAPMNDAGQAGEASEAGQLSKKKLTDKHETNEEKELAIKQLYMRFLEEAKNNHLDEQSVLVQTVENMYQVAISQSVSL